jgi:hypothetical protein
VMIASFLKYINHDLQREKPVHFHWQILEVDSTRDYELLLDLTLEPAPSITSDTFIPAHDSVQHVKRPKVSGGHRHLCQQQWSNSELISAGILP